MNDIHSIPDDITKIIMFDYCGFIDTSKIDESAFKEIKCKLLLYHILIFIFILSLLFAIYCGVVFMIQNDNNFDKYSINLECECSDILYKDEYYTEHLEDGYHKKRRWIWLHRIKDENNFYDETWIPYIQKYEPELIEYAMDDLYIIKEDKIYPNCYVEFDADSNGANKRKVSSSTNILLHLSAKGIDDCDYIYKEWDCCQGCPKYSSCGQCCCQCLVGIFVAVMIIIILCCIAGVHSTFNNMQYQLGADILRTLKDIDL